MERDKIICNLFCEDYATNRKKLFKQALKYANHGKVLYILYKELNELPNLSQNLNSFNNHTMKLISFMYVQTLESLVESIATLPNWENIPSTIILDDLTSFCDKNNLQNACGIVSLLINTIKDCSMSQPIQCRLSISVDKNVVDKQYFDTLKDLYLNESYG